MNHNNHNTNDAFKIEFKQNRSASIDVAPRPILFIREETKRKDLVADEDEDYEYTSRFKSSSNQRRSSHSDYLAHTNATHTSSNQQKKILFPMRDSSVNTPTSKYNSQTIFHPTWNEWKRQHSTTTHSTTTTTTTQNNENINSQHQNTNNKSIKLHEESNINNSKIKKSSLSHINNNFNAEKQQQKQQQEKEKNSYNFASFSSSLSSLKQQQQQQQNQETLFSNKKMQDYYDALNSANTHGKSRVNSEAMSNINKQQTLKKQKSLKTSLKSKKLTHESDSDGEIQHRLLSKATGSIPIEYISIRRDPKPIEKKEKSPKKVITTGTNTVIERGRKIAATNTDNEIASEMPTYNLHLSLDSLLPKVTNEVATETSDQVKMRDACMQHTTDAETDSEVEKVTQTKNYYHHESSSSYNEMRSRRAQYEKKSNDDYKLEFLAKTPRLLRKKCEAYKRLARVYTHEDDECCYHTDDDDRLVFGQSFVSNQSFNSNQHLNNFIQQSCAPQEPPLTRRYVRTTNTTTYAPLQAAMQASLQQQQQNNYLDYNSNFDQMNTKFDQIFGSSTAKSDASYSFGEIFKNNQFSSSSGIYSQSQQHNQHTPQAEPITQTPNLTLRSRSFTKQQTYGPQLDRTLSPASTNTCRTNHYHSQKRHQQQQQVSCAMQQSSLNQSFDSERQFLPIHVRNSDSEYQH